MPPQKTFTHIPNSLVLPPLDVRHNERGREYRLPNGVWVPSVTTVLGYFEKPHLDHWREAVGHEEADRIAKRAARRGEKLHKLCEQYLNNETLKFDNPLDLQAFRQLKVYLDKIDNIVAQESQLYSTVLGIAGRLDVDAEYEGTPAIIDFKTSRTEKDAFRIEHYFEQETCYSLMIEERYGRKIEDLVVLVENMHDNNPKVWRSKRADHIDKLVRKIQIYKEETYNV